MPRATIAGAAPQVKTKRKDGDEPARRRDADAGGDDGVLVDQFTREFQAVLRQVKDAQRSGGEVQHFSADCDAQVEKRSVAHYGVVSQRLLALVRRLVDRTPDLDVDKKARLLLHVGDKFVAIHEFQAADRYFYSEIAVLSATKDSQQDTVTESCRRKDDVYVRALFGQATSRFQVAKRADPFVRFPGTLERLLESLQLLQHGMEVTVALERATPHAFAWLLLNGSILMYSITRPLQTLGFERETVVYFKWCILCLESTVMLSTTKYIRWRLQLYTAVCECLECLATKQPTKASGYRQSALACAEHAVQCVAKLRKEEEMDLPLPQAVVATLRHAETISEALIARARSLAKGEVLGRKAIESSPRFQDTRDRVWFTVDALDKAHDKAATSDLVDFALELVQPLIRSSLDTSVTGSEAASQVLDGSLPIALHLGLIRHACRVHKWDGAASLLEAATERISSMRETDAPRLELNLLRALIDLDKPVPANENEPTSIDNVHLRQRILATAQAARQFAVGLHEAVPMALRDLLITTAVRLWKEGAVDMLRELDDSPTPDDVELSRELVQQAVCLLEAIYTTLRAVYFDDLIVLGEVCMRLSLLLNTQENRRKAIRTLRDFLGLLNTHRDRIISAASHFRTSTDGHTLSLASFSFDVHPDASKSDCYGTHDSSSSAFSRRRVGVEGTGSQLGSLQQELACIQVDVMLLMFRMELEEAAMVDAMESDTTQHTAAQVVPSRRSSMLTLTESALQKEYKKNLYARVLLNVQLVQRKSNRSDELVNECFKLLSQLELQERELIRHVLQPDTNPVSPPETTTPRAPIIISRCSSSITLQVLPFKPSSAAARRRPIVYYMLFGKPSGAGTDVTLNNVDLPGTGEPLYSPNLCVTVSGLHPNTSYVFAVAAFDDQGENIQGIGETTKPVVALHALPLVACYGYLAQVCYDTKRMQPARMAAAYVYDCIVSKRFDDRPGWAANFFYRHALKRAVVARWPLPLQDLAVQCILVLCDTEDGDALRDGQLTSDGLLLRGRQIAALETSRIVAIGLEIACAATDFEQIRALCFKGYRVLLPVLHLDDSNALVFAALSTFYQALWCIPAGLWDTDTRSVAARIAFELMRIAWRHHHLADAVYNQVVKLKDAQCSDDNPTPTNNELAALLDSIALAECSIRRPLVESPSQTRPSTAVTSAQPAAGKSTGVAATGGAKAPPAAASATPQTTARAAEETLLPRVSELISQSKLNVRDAFKILEPFLKTSRDGLEVFCKICHCAIAAGDEDALEEWMPLLKVNGTIGTTCKEALKSAGLGHFLPEPVPVPSVTPSAPSTARSTAKTPRGQDAVAPSLQADASTAPQQVTPREPEIGENDQNVYTWCGEVCLLEAKAQLRKLARHRNEHDEANCMRGPRYDYAFSILNGVQASASRVETTSMEHSSISSGADDKASAKATPRVEEERDTSMALLGSVMSRAAASCRLFRLAQAWQALQTAAQYASNAIWQAWVSPEALGLHEHASTLDDLVVCVESLLDMIELVSAALKEEQSGKTPTTLPVAGSDASKLAMVSHKHNHTLSLASTTIVVSAMSSLNADQTWVSNLLEFTIQSLLAAARWHKLVQIGKTYHLLSGGSTRFSEKILPLLVHAQQQHLSEQTVRFESAETEVAAFVKAFQDAEAKKKKKKSRLVVEEILTPEELQFRHMKENMDRHIQELAYEKSVRQRELDELKQMHEATSRTTNKCTQAIDNCHGLVEKFRRFGESRVKPQQIVNAFSECIMLSRQKRQRRLAGKALQELGDFFWARGDTKSAAKVWNEAIDNAFNVLRATTCWREIVGAHVEEESTAGDALIEGDGLWICLESCIAMAKLILLDSPAVTPTLELARMAAATVTRILTKSSLPHPSRLFLFGFYQLCSQSWPGRELLVDSERLDAPRLALMFSVTIQTLLQYEHPVEAMPLIAAYEYLSMQFFEDVDSTANARRLRLDALVQCGRFQEAFQVLAALLSKIELGREEKPRVPPPLTSRLRFRDDKPIKDPINSDVHTWLAAIDMSKVFEDLLALQLKPDTARLIVVSMLKLVVGLAQREAIEEEMASPVRQIASKMAASVIGLLTKTLDQRTQSLPPHDEEISPRTEYPRSAADFVWETLVLHHTHAEIVLQQSIVAASSGQWAAAQDLCTQTVHVALRSRTASEEARRSVDSSILSLDQALPPAFLYRSTAFVVRARLLSVKVDIAQGKYHHAIKRIHVAVEEARLHGEQLHFVRQLELLRAETLVLLGSRDAAIRELTTLRDAFISGHSCECLPYVELVRVLSFVLRSQAMEGPNSSQTLQRVLTLLEEAESVLDRVLRRDGWIGADVDAATDKRMSLFNPNVVAFVQLKAEIGQALMETPVVDPKDNASRLRRALLTIESALKSVDHSLKSLAPTKARLLLQKGVILKKLVSCDSASSRCEDLFEQCAATLLASVEENIRVGVGGHDRDLIRFAFMELVDLYGAKPIKDKEAEHLQAAFHYLNLALLVTSYQRILLDSVELQAGSLAATDKLPAFVISAIHEPTGVASSVTPESARPTPPPAKGGKETATSQSAHDASKRPTVDATRLMNFFVDALREKNLLPPSNCLQEDVVVLVHTFLVQNHSTYAKTCCLSSIPAVPRNDPEIKGGLICTQWMRDLAPAFTPSTHLSSRGALSLFFTLGTARIDGHNALAENDEGIHSRVELFATSPLLNKRTGIVETDVRELGAMLSHLRIDMEDDESLVLDRTGFLLRFKSILRQIQRMFRRSSVAHSEIEGGHSHSTAPNVEAHSSSPEDSSDLILDGFNVAIPVICTLDMVKIMEAMFQVERGVNNAIDNTLCYFLRDLLDS